MLDDSGCSRHHAEIESRPNGYVIRDLRSTNGLYVNGRKVTQSALVSGDTFTIGRNQFSFIVGTAEESDETHVFGDTLEVEELDTLFIDDTHFAGLMGGVDADELASLKRAHRQMKFVVEVSRALNSTLDKDSLFPLLIDAVFEEFKVAGRASIFLTTDDDLQSFSEVYWRTRSGEEPRTVSLPLLRDVVARRVAAILSPDEEAPAAVPAWLKGKAMCAPLVIGERVLGVIYLESTSVSAEFEKHDLELFSVLAHQSAASIGNSLLYEELEVSFFETVRSLSNALEAKDQYTRGHSDRVARYAVGIGRRLGLSDVQLRTLRVAAELHDIGKIAIREAIIGKSGKLSDEEFEMIKRHPQLGVNILRPISFLKPALPIILHHHERYGGNGYPSQLRGAEIPLEARILNLADAFDAMTTQRSYNSPRSVIDAICHCRDEAGVSFDPDCVQALIEFIQSEFDSLEPDGTHRFELERV